MQHQMFHGANRTGAIGWVSSGSALINVLLNVLLVPWWGPLGAAIATVVAYGAGCLALYAVGGTSVRFPLFPGYLLKCLIAACAMTGAVIVSLKLPLGSDLAHIAVAIVLAPAVYFPLLIKLGGFSAEERQGLRSLLRWRAAPG
jgi:O-antigen/teichoic acid export membrane protein